MTIGRAALVFVLCICASFICAFAFASLVGFNLPSADWAYGDSITQRLSDPFVYNGMILGGILFGIVSFPFVYFATRNRRLKATAPPIFGIVLGEIVVLTPIARMANLFGAIIALAIALALCVAGVFD